MRNKNHNCRLIGLMTDEETLSSLRKSYGRIAEGADAESLARMDGALSSAADWLCGKLRQCLVLCGPAGTGKTTLIQAMADTLSDAKAYAEAKGYYGVKGLAAAGAENTKDFNEETMMCPFPLAIDDIGAEPPVFNDFGTRRSPVAETIMRRYSAGLPTVLATNLTEEELGEVYGERVADRLRERYSFLALPGPSFRGRNNH